MKGIEELKFLLRCVHDKNFKKLEDVKVIIEHHGAPNDEKEISGKEIINVDRRGITLFDDTFIPFYRIKRVIK